MIPPTPRTRVRLRVWGCTVADAKGAEITARQSPRSHAWHIVEVIPSCGSPCPIPRRDPLALTQGAEYDEAWAVYRTTSDAGHTQ